MPKTNRDVIARAYRRMNVVQDGEDLPSEYYATGNDVLEGLFAELAASHDIFIVTDDVADEQFLPMADLLVTELASGYGIPSPSRAATIARLRAATIPNDIVELTQEPDARRRAQYY